MDKLFKELELSDLEGEIKEIAEHIGIEATRLLIKEFGGASYYIPLLRTIRKFRERMAKELKQRGKTVQQIAILLNCSVNTIRRDLGEGIK